MVRVDAILATVMTSVRVFVVILAVDYVLKFSQLIDPALRGQEGIAMPP